MQAPGRFCDCLPAHAAAPAHAPGPFGLKYLIRTGLRVRPGDPAPSRPAGDMSAGRPDATDRKLSSPVIGFDVRFQPAIPAGITYLLVAHPGRMSRAWCQAGRHRRRGGSGRGPATDPARVVAAGSRGRQGAQRRSARRAVERGDRGPGHYQGVASQVPERFTWPGEPAVITFHPTATRPPACG